jgi:hypothetical protein
VITAPNNNLVLCKNDIVVTLFVDSSRYIHPKGISQVPPPQKVSNIADVKQLLRDGKLFQEEDAKELRDVLLECFNNSVNDKATLALQLVVSHLCAHLKDRQDAMQGVEELLRETQDIKRLTMGNTMQSGLAAQEIKHREASFHRLDLQVHILKQNNDVWRRAVIHEIKRLCLHEKKVVEEPEDHVLQRRVSRLSIHALKRTLTKELSEDMPLVQEQDSKEVLPVKEQDSKEVLPVKEQDSKEEAAQQDVASPVVDASARADVAPAPVDADASTAAIELQEVPPQESAAKEE